jgi:HEAT repeats
VGGEHLLYILADKTGPVEARVAAAQALGARSAAEFDVWGALCSVLQDPHDVTEVRLAAAQALGEYNVGGVRNQLTRYLQGDVDRRIRREAVGMLSRLGRVPEGMEPALQRDLQALEESLAAYPLVNLALTYGRDPRVLEVLDRASRHADPEIRAIAQRGLGMLGEMSVVIQALRDESPQVRQGAAETLGYYSLLAPEEITALQDALQDPDARVQRAARTAWRRLGLQPIPQPGIKQSAKRSSVPSQAATASSRSAPSQFDWAPLLEQWSRQWLSVREYAVELPDETIESGWLGYPGATAQELVALDHRLGRVLPPSYRAFLGVSNGWRRTSPFMDHLYSTAEVDYFRARNQWWIDIWVEERLDVSEEQHRAYLHKETQTQRPFRAAYLQECVQVSEAFDGAVYLLNPAVVTSEGEWEAWFLASWLPGARRYRSFWDLLRAEYESFVRLVTQLPAP